MLLVLRFSQDNNLYSHTIKMLFFFYCSYLTQYDCVTFYNFLESLRYSKDKIMLHVLVVIVLYDCLGESYSGNDRPAVLPALTENDVSTT